MECLNCEKETNKTLKDFSKEPLAHMALNIPVCRYHCTMVMLQELIDDIRDKRVKDFKRKNLEKLIWTQS